jgi:hypothetical protein
MPKISSQQVKKIKEFISEASKFCIEYDKKIRNANIDELEKIKKTLKSLRNSLVDFIKKRHPEDTRLINCLDDFTLLQLISFIKADLRDLSTQIIAITIETSGENIKHAVQQISKAKDKADEALQKLQKLRKGLEVLSKVINLAGAIGLLVAAPNLGTLSGVINSAGELIDEVNEEIS